MPATIVCGVDESDAAGAVAATAARLAGALGAELVLLHVVEPGEPEEDAFLSSLPGDVRRVEGAPADRLLEAVDTDGAELLVVGSRGRGAIRAALFGSVSRRLSAEARCPVVVVPPDAAAPADGGSSIVCGVDGSDHSTAAARLAHVLARRLGLRLIVVNALAELSGYVSYPGARATMPSPSAQPDSARTVAQGLVDAAVAAVGGEATGVVEPGLPWEVLEAVADREDGQLLVIAARGLSAARTALLGSVAAELAANGRRPLAILPPPAEHAWQG